jgi:type II secretory pathway pseudopilin PulG
MIPIPTFLMSPRVLLASGLALSVFYAGWATRGALAASQLAQAQAQHAQAVATAEKNLRAAIDQARQREDALTTTTQGIVNEARTIVQNLESQIGRADAASGGLLDSARRAASRCTANQSATPARGSPGTSLPSGMSDGDRWLRVLGELDGFAGAAAEDSGRARAARDACQRSYEAVMQAVNQ